MQQTAGSDEPRAIRPRPLKTNTISAERTARAWRAILDHFDACLMCRTTARGCEVARALLQVHRDARARQR
ncbi:hypothetical protein [Streptomyces sp. NPDC018031]|uniref:hypothetical protein n=1 Tax=Streptomyces sp. NPDC018031 TaxID=3365033 RepID=UPI0037B0217A